MNDEKYHVPTERPWPMTGIPFGTELALPEIDELDSQEWPVYDEAKGG